MQMAFMVLAESHRLQTARIDSDSHNNIATLSLCATFAILNALRASQQQQTKASRPEGESAGSVQPSVWHLPPVVPVLGLA